jgi:hypothetical protein
MSEIKHTENVESARLSMAVSLHDHGHDAPEAVTVSWHCGGYSGMLHLNTESALDLAAALHNTVNASKRAQQAAAARVAYDAMNQR